MTLLEAVVGLAIVAMTAVAALAAAGADLRASVRVRRVLDAQALAAERVSELDLLSEREIRRLPDSVAAGRFAPPLADYRWETASRPLAGEAGVYDVTVRVAWADSNAGGNAGGNVALRTRVYRRPAVVSTR